MFSAPLLPFSRRRFLQGMAALGTALCLPGESLAAGAPILRPVPSSSEMIPVVGLGTWLTFDVGSNAQAREVRRQVLQGFFDRGGRLIDSSPMYVSSEAVVGALLRQVKGTKPFAATKVWILGRAPGIWQMERSQKVWGVSRFDLMQIHNLVDWETHLETLKTWKAEGRVRYIGITTSHGRRHEELEKAMKSSPFDFVQFTYNLADRSVENRLLPLAAEHGIAVIINRPLDGGHLFDRVRGKPLPPWASEFDCANWAQFFLKFVVSHPAVTCAIPATSNPAHLQENMGAMRGRLPDEAQCRRMARLIAEL